MSYQEQNDRYRDMGQRGRYEMCVREQAHLTYAGGADPSSAALADAVIGGGAVPIDALIAAICVGPNSAVLGGDADLTAAVQAVWGQTAAALHPQV